MDELEEADIRALVGRAQRGDPDALNEAFRLVRPGIERWVALRFGSHLRTRLDIEDIVQETLANAMEVLPEFEYGEPGAFARWLRAIAENRLRDANKFFRRKRRDSAREEFLREALAAASTTPRSRLVRIEERERLLEALSSLKAEDRDVIRMIRFEGRSYAEAGRELGITATAAGVRLVRAMKTLSAPARIGRGARAGRPVVGLSTPRPCSDPPRPSLSFGSAAPGGDGTPTAPRSRPGEGMRT